MKYVTQRKFFFRDTAVSQATWENRSYRRWETGKVTMRPGYTSGKEVQREKLSVVSAVFSAGHIRATV